MFAYILSYYYFFIRYTIRSINAAIRPISFSIYSHSVHHKGDLHEHFLRIFRFSSSIDTFSVLLIKTIVNLFIVSLHSLPSILTLNNFLLVLVLGIFRFIIQSTFICTLAGEISLLFVSGIFWAVSFLDIDLVVTKIDLSNSVSMSLKSFYEMRESASAMTFSLPFMCSISKLYSSQSRRILVNLYAGFLSDTDRLRVRDLIALRIFYHRCTVYPAELAM